MIRVLSIDDSRAVHAVLDGMMKLISAEIVHAYDGVSGLDLLTKEKATFDVILLDWEMPQWTGIETLKRIREAGIKTPVVMLTSKNAPEDLMLALDSGADEYLMKPFVEDVVFEKIESVLGRGIR